MARRADLLAEVAIQMAMFTSQFASTPRTSAYIASLLIRQQKPGVVGSVQGCCPGNDVRASQQGTRCWMFRPSC